MCSCSLGLHSPLAFSTMKITQLHLSHTPEFSSQCTHLLRRLRRPLGSQNFHPCPRNGQGWTGEASPNRQGQKEPSLHLPWLECPERKRQLAQFCLSHIQKKRTQTDPSYNCAHGKAAEMKGYIIWGKRIISRVLRIFLSKNKEYKKLQYFGFRDFSVVFLHVFFSNLLANTIECVVCSSLAPYPKSSEMIFLFWAGGERV